MASPPRLVLAPFGVAYGAAVRARLALYRAGLLKVHGAGAPVVSVGNITAGGTGKTPLVEWLARALAAGAGRRVCVLTRGYARADEGRRVVVSDGETLSAGAREGGDEPRLLAAPQATPPREPLFAFCGVGNPGAFFAQLRREGYGVGRERAFKDHHFYTQSDADSLSREAGRAGARSLVTTAKDAVKLRGLKFGLPCYVLEIGLSFDEEDALLELVLKVVRRG
ncbi:MAG: tetraacyldisaccharide 4'-kinase [Acidobacteria bacterium]|nr:tetraacyldisaccharide 4'-kinase [Acidobacteriota bacterium]